MSVLGTKPSSSERAASAHNLIAVSPAPASTILLIMIHRSFTMESLSLTYLCVLQYDVRTTWPSTQRWAGSRKAVKEQSSMFSSTQRVLHDTPCKFLTCKHHRCTYTTSQSKPKTRFSKNLVRKNFKTD